MKNAADTITALSARKPRLDLLAPGADPSLDVPLVRFLCERFEHAPRTDVAKRRINNKDFIVLCMYALGRPIGLRELRRLSGAWRGQVHYMCSDEAHPDDGKLDPYFGPHYGHTATAKDGKGRFSGTYCSNRHPMYWYRAIEHREREVGHRAPRSGAFVEAYAVPMQRYRNDLTVQGLARARALLACP